MEKIENPVQLEEFWKTLEPIQNEYKSIGLKRITKPTVDAHKAANPKKILEHVFGRSVFEIADVECKALNKYFSETFPHEVVISPEIAYVMLKDHQAYVQKINKEASDGPVVYGFIKAAGSSLLAALFPSPLSAGNAVGDTVGAVVQLKKYKDDIKRIEKERDKIAATILDNYEMVEFSPGEYKLVLANWIVKGDVGSDMHTPASATCVRNSGISSNVNTDQLIGAVESKLGRSL